jgi:hypothetical protein
MRRLSYIFIFIFFNITLEAQEVIQLNGVVTFKAAENIYLKFDNTEKIKAGDTIYLAKNPDFSCLRVIRKSTSSVVCLSIKNCEIAKNDTVIFKHIIRIEQKGETEKIASNIESEELVKEIKIDEVLNDKLKEKKDSKGRVERVRARFSVGSQSNFSNVFGQDRHRMMLRFSLNANNLQDSRFSVESYINYRKNYYPRSVDYRFPTSFYNVYNLALKYEFDDQSRITLGRKINPKISSIGPIDGLQVEKYFGNLYFGSIFGFKPDIADFGFNKDLLEYGGYIGYSVSNEKIYSQSTIGFLEQKNKGFIDRRYAYLQHSSSLNNRVSIFASGELDLYENINGSSTNHLRLSNFYSSLRIRAHKRVSVMLSYDSRRRIILYETFRTEIERLLADDEARQGVRFRVNFNPIKYLNSGFAYMRRFQIDSENKSNNLNGYISHSKVPLLEGRVSLNFNKNQSNYANSLILSIRHSRSLIPRVVEGDFYYRYTDYDYFGSDTNLVQQFYGLGFTFRIDKQLAFSLLGEYNKSEIQNNLRINTRIIKRFY